MVRFEIMYAMMSIHLICYARRALATGSLAEKQG